MNFTIAKNGNEAICSTVGGELVSFKSGGREYVWYGLPEHWSGQAPCLFPVVCRAKDDIIVVDGAEYPMPKHGVARKVEYKPVEVTPDSVRFRLCDSEETRKHYPYGFVLDITHKVTERGFSTFYTVENTNDSEMSFCIGGHPGFNCPLNGGESFEDYSLVFDDASGAVAHITEPEGGYMDPDMPALDIIRDNEIKLKYSDFDNDAIIVEDLPVKKVRLVNRKTGHGILFEFDSFDAIGFWTPIKQSSPFICLEPWNGLPGSLGETSELCKKKYAKTIAPGESFSTGYTVTVI